MYVAFFGAKAYADSMPSKIPPISPMNQYTSDLSNILTKYLSKAADLGKECLDKNIPEDLKNYASELVDMVEKYIPKTPKYSCATCK